MLLTSGRNIDRIARHRLLYAEEARRLLAAGHAARAVELCRHGLIYFPEDHTGYVLLANAFIMLGERERALNVLADGFRRTGSPRLERLRAEVAGEVPIAGASTPDVTARDVSVEEVVAEGMPKSVGDSDAAPIAAMPDEDARSSPADESTVPIADELQLHAPEAWHDEIEIREIEPGSPVHAPTPDVIVPASIAADLMPSDAVASNGAENVLPDAAAVSAVGPGVGASPAPAVPTADDERTVDLDALDRVQEAIAAAIAQVQGLRPPAPVEELPEYEASPVVEPPADESTMPPTAVDDPAEPEMDAAPTTEAEGLDVDAAMTPAGDPSMGASPGVDAPGVDAPVADVPAPDVDPMTAEVFGSEESVEWIDTSMDDVREQGDQPVLASDEIAVDDEIGVLESGERMQDVRTTPPALMPVPDADAGGDASLPDASVVDAYPEADLLITALPESVAVDPLMTWQDAMPEPQAQDEAAGCVPDAVIEAGIGTAEPSAPETTTGETPAEETTTTASSVDETATSDSVHAISPEFVEDVSEPATSHGPSVSLEHAPRVEASEPVAEHAAEHVAATESADEIEVPEAVAVISAPAEIAERPRSLGLALHTVKNAARLRSSNLRLIPGLEFAPLRREDAGRHQSIAPLINEPMPQPELPPRRASLEAAAMPPLPELEHDGGAAPPPMTPPTASAAEHAAESGSGEGERAEPTRERVPRTVPVTQLPLPDETLTPLEELARRLERARIPVIDEAEQRMAFEPSLVSETLANILVAQGAYAEALKAFQTLARAKPERLEYFQQRIVEIEQHLERQTNG